MGTACLNLIFIVFSLFEYSVVKVACESNGTSNIVELAHKGCAHNSFCDLKSTPLSTGYFSCCAECACSDYCFVGNKCCPDSEVSRRHQATCKTQSEFFDNHRNVLIPDNSYAINFYAIDTCKEGYDNESIYGCLHPPSLDDHVFFSDINSQTIFKNRKCAACNGVEKYYTWQQTILCPYDEAIVSYVERRNYILGHCRLVSEPPEAFKDSFDALVCNNRAISECNVTGEWDHLDLEMEQACKSFNMEYRDERVFRGRILGYRTYRNVYCFLCNKRKGTVAQPRCLTDVRADTGRLLSGLPAITAVFDDRPDEIFTTSKCMSDEIKEPILGSCKQLFCPFGETAVFGACRAYIQLVVVTLSTSYDVRFEQLEESDVSYVIIDGLLEEVKRKVQATFCDLCELVIYSRRLMVITATTSPKCPAKKLLKLHEYFSTQKTMRRRSELRL